MGTTPMPRRVPRATARLTAAALALAVAACGAQDDHGAGGRRAPTTSASAPAPATSPRDPLLERAMADLEDEHDVRLGVHVVDTASERTLSWRADERFAFASTIKAPLAGAVLDALTTPQLSRVVRFETSDLVPYSPVTERRVADGMTVRELIDAALRSSDNTAANLLYDVVGGPSGLDRALDDLGDRVTDPERVEPELNTAVPGDRRDTTTPRAIAGTLRAYVLGDALPSGDRALLRDTMVASTTGDDLVRAGVPTGWTVADRSGSASYGVRNDVAVLLPPGGTPIVLAVMSTGDGVDDVPNDRAVADATRAVVDALTRTAPQRAPGRG